MTIYTTTISNKIKYFKSPNGYFAFVDFVIVLNVFNNVNNDIKIDFDIQSQWSQHSSTKIKKKKIHINIH